MTATAFRSSFLILAILSLATAAGDAAEVAKVQPGAGFYDNFAADGSPGLGIDSLKPASKNKASQPIILKMVKEGNKKTLYLKGGFQTMLFYPGREYKDFVLETTLQKKRGSYAGVVVRDHWRVYLQMRGFLCINTNARGMFQGKLFKSDKRFSGLHKLKVVCAGPMMHVYVDGQHIVSREIPDKPGKVGYYSHGSGEGYYRDFRIDTNVEPGAFFSIKATAPGDALVFAPNTPAKVTFQISNYSRKAGRLSLEATVTDWDGKALKPAVSEEVVAKVGTTGITLNLGALAEGFHAVRYTGKLDGKPFVEVDDLPVAIQQRGDGQFTAPVFPISVYSKYFGNSTPVYMNTYAHRIARILKDRAFNAIVADPSFTKSVVDIYQSYGIATITRGKTHLDHPGAIGALLGDEPKPEHIDKLKRGYANMAEVSGKPVTTCLVGEIMGLSGEHGPVSIWRRLDAQVRAFRWYGIKKSFYSILHDLKYKGILPLSSVMRIVEASDDADWWFVPPSFGVNKHEGYFMNPSPTQMKGMMHMAMAHGADGLMLWCLQDWGSFSALIKQKSLMPTDGKLQAASEAAATISKHADLLVSLGYGGFEVRNSNPIYVEAVPRKTKDGKTYIYVVNKDDQKPATATIAFKGRKARDLFSGRDIATQTAAGGLHAVTLTLDPCKAALLAVDVQAPAARKITPLTGDAKLSDALMSKVAAQVREHGVAVLATAMPGQPCIRGDAIGLWRADDPRAVWKQAKADPRCLNWSGLLQERTAEGYLPLRSALKLAEVADAKTPFWTVYPVAGNTRPTPDQLRAMIHLALAYGSKAVVVSDAAAPSLGRVVTEVARAVSPHGKLVASLRHAGAGIRCRNAMVAAVPRQAGKKGNLCVYVVNMDMHNTVTAELLSWAKVWDWTKARDVFGGKDLQVKQRNKEGYLSLKITLKPGEGLLLETDLKINRK